MESRVSSENLFGSGAAETRLQRVTVVFASDNRGVLPLSVAVWSVVENADATTCYDVCVLSDGIESDNREKLMRLVSKSGERHRVRFIDVENEIPNQLKVMERWPKVAWARVFVANLLPEVDRAIYLDIDTLVCTDLKALINTPMGDAALGVVLETESQKGNRYYEQLHIPLHCPGYFNSGVLLMNLDVFRRDNLVEYVMKYAREHFDVLECPDQDALNGALCDRLVRLHPRWNWHDGLTRLIIKRKLTDNLWRGNKPKQSIEAALYPGILHYQGKYKPWRYNWRMEGSRYAECMLRAGLVEKLPLPGWSLAAWIKNRCYKFMYMLTWRKIRSFARELGVAGPPSGGGLY